MAVTDQHPAGASTRPRMVAVDRERLARFLRAIGEDRPEYTGVAGSGPPVPPTYLYCLEDLERGEDRSLLDSLGAPRSGALHVAQHFRYHRAVVAGEHLLVSTRLFDRFPRRGNTIRLVITQTAFTDPSGRPVAELRCTLAFPRRGPAQDGVPTAAPVGPGTDAVAVHPIPAPTRRSLARYAEASGDHNPIHLHPEAARAEGLPDVIGHGMYVMARAARVLDQDLAEYEMRFLSPIRLGVALTAEASRPARGDDVAGVHVVVTDRDGQRIAVGRARTRQND